LSQTSGIPREAVAHDHAGQMVLVISFGFFGHFKNLLCAGNTTRLTPIRIFFLSK
jgi:hypothetical protein